jgi:Mce-associated membrane protein
VRTWRPTPRLLWGITAVLLLAAVAVAATLGRTAWQQQREVDNGAAALAAGKQIAVNFVTMNAATFDADTKRVLAESTGAFQKEYASTLAQLKPVVTANKTVSTVERAEASLVSSDDDSAKVIVGVVAPTSNASTPTAEKKTYRLRLDLVKVGDAWKVSTLDFVS